MGWLYSGQTLWAGYTADYGLAIQWTDSMGWLYSGQTLWAGYTADYGLAIQWTLCGLAV